MSERPRIDLGLRRTERPGAGEALPIDEAMRLGEQAYIAVAELLPGHEWAQRIETDSHVQDILDFHVAQDPQHFDETLRGLEQAQVIYGFVPKDTEPTEEKVAFVWRVAGSLDVTTVEVEPIGQPLVTVHGFEADGVTQKPDRNIPFTKVEAQRIASIQRAMNDELIGEYLKALDEDEEGEASN